MSYPESNALSNDTLTFGDRKVNRSVHLKHIYTDSSVKNAWKSFIEFTDPGKGFLQSALIFKFYPNEGILKTKKDETVFPYREHIYTVMIFARWTDEKDDKEAFKWLNQNNEIFLEDTKEDMIFPNCYGPLTEDLTKPELSYGKENLEILKELKRKYDPTCFFNKWIPIKI